MDSKQSGLHVELRKLVWVVEQQLVVEQQASCLLDIYHNTWQGADNFFGAILKQ
jgi:hypothetical protein